MRPSYISTLGLALLVTLGACDQTDTGIDIGGPPPGPYRLTLEGNATLSGPHGDQSIHVVVVSRNFDFVVAQATATISSTEGSSFDFAFPRLLAEGGDYDVFYWIDSNIGGGSVGTCDPAENDHQWSEAVLNPRAGIFLEVGHNDADNTEVCSSFPE